MAVTQYIGSRYVPLFAEPIEWSSQNTYEPLTIVIHEGNSYTSRQAVPKDIAIDNEDFWALTGNYNAQIELYRRRVEQVSDEVDDLETHVDSEIGRIETHVDSEIGRIETELSAQIGQVESNLSADIGEVATGLEGLTQRFNELLGEGKDANLLDEYVKEIDSYVTIVALDRSKYIMNDFIPYGTYDQDDVYIQDVLKQKEGFYCAPNLPSDYFIRDGVHKVDSPQMGCLLCVDNDNNYSVYRTYGTVPNPDTLISLGVKNALWVFEPLVLDGNIVPTTDVPSTVTNVYNQQFALNPRFIIGWDAQYVYLILINGRLFFGKGTTHEQSATLLHNLGIDNAINCDGGGSIQLWLCPSAYNLAILKQSHSSMYPNQGRAKPLTGFVKVSS